MRVWGHHGQYANTPLLLFHYCWHVMKAVAINYGNYLFHIPINCDNVTF